MRGRGSLRIPIPFLFIGAASRRDLRSKLISMISESHGTRLGQCECDDFVAGDDRDVLLATPAGIAHGIRVRVRFEHSRPQLPSLRGIERAKPPIARRT